MAKLVNKTYALCLLAWMMLFNSSLVNAQTKEWQRSFSHSQSSLFCNQLVELSDGHLLMVYEIGDRTRVGMPGYLMKLDENGEKVDSLSVPNLISGYDFWLLDMSIDQSHIFLIGQATSTSDSTKSYPALLKLDQHFNLLMDSVLMSYPDLAFGKIVRITSQKLVLEGSVQFNAAPHIGHGFIELDRQFRVNTLAIDSGQYSPLYRSIYLPHSHTYYTVYLNEIIEYDGNDFYRKDILSKGRFFTNDLGTAPEILNDSTFLIYGCHTNHNWVTNDHDYDVWGYAINDQLQVVDSFMFEDPNAMETHGYWGMDKANNSGVFVGSTENLSCFGTPRIFEAKSEQSFVLRYLDQNLDEVWKTAFGGDINYDLEHVVATHDGGVLLVGQRWDWKNRSDQQVDLHMIKVNPKGKPSDIPMLIQEDDIQVYPNPVTDQLRFKSSISPNERMNYAVYNNQGRLVMQGTSTMGEGIHGFNYLPTAIYSVHVVLENRREIPISKKVIKQ